MKKVVLFAITAVLLSSCVSRKFVVTNKSNETVDFYLQGNKVKALEPNESIEKTLSSGTPIRITGRIGGNYNKYSVNYTSDIDSKLIKIQTQTNIKEVSHSFEPNGSEDIERIEIWFQPVSEQSINTGYGYLKLESNEKNVDIYLDDVFIGKIDKGALNKKIKVGKHNLMAKKEYYMPNSINFEIKDKEVFQHIFSLQTVAGWSETKPGFTKTQQARGNLTVVTEKSDFVVYIEGVQKVPPFELKDMPSGKYNLKIVCEDFEKTIEVIVPFEETEFIDLDELFPR